MSRVKKLANSMLPKEIQYELENALASRTGETVKVQAASPVSGGSINQAAAVTTTEGKYFVKWNSAARHPGMFEAEAKGLQLLKKPGELFIPGVVHIGAAGKDAFLVLEFVEQGRKLDDFWEAFGISLARLHSQTNEKFGLDHDNYIGSLPQSNTRHSAWSEFFACERLEPQLRLARDEGKVTRQLASRFANLFTVLDEIFPAEKPALLHGDLWSGNFMVSPSGSACIMDPAVYFGHREMDIAMTRLFGGFAEGFYDGYMQQRALEKGWEKRIDLCNLYPLLVHVNLFGGGYISQVESIMKRF